MLIKIATTMLLKSKTNKLFFVSRITRCKICAIRLHQLRDQLFNLTPKSGRSIYSKNFKIILTMNFFTYRRYITIYEQQPFNTNLSILIYTSVRCSFRSIEWHKLHVQGIEFRGTNQVGQNICICKGLTDLFCLNLKNS